MNLDYNTWKIIIKFDPDKNISKDQIEELVDKADAFMISGTQNITRKKVVHLVNILKEYDIPKVLEPVNPEAVVYKGIDYIFVPYIFNTRNLEWCAAGKRHLRWIREQRQETKKSKVQEIKKSKVVMEAYISLNPNAAVTKLTGANTNLSLKEIKACSLAAQYLGTPIVYLEGSGEYFNPKDIGAVNKYLKEGVESADNTIKKSRLYYGGAINSRKRAREMSPSADTIVIGNAVYEGKALETIV